jgi:hypothetical protein
VVRRPPARTADGWAVCSAAGTLEQKGERFIGTNILELDNDPQHRRHRGWESAANDGGTEFRRGGLSLSLERGRGRYVGGVANELSKPTDPSRHGFVVAPYQDEPVIGLKGCS